MINKRVGAAALASCAVLALTACNPAAERGGEEPAASQSGSGTFTGPKKHYRIWAGTHDHTSNVDRFSFLTPHKDGFYDHSPSEDWEVMKDDLSTQMTPEHIRYADAYYRYGWGDWRTKFWNGYMDRVGGLHNGNY